MLIAGAKGHAKEVLEIIPRAEWDTLVFYDDLSSDTDRLFDRFRILQSPAEAKAYFHHDPHFILGIGNPFLRKQFAQKLTSYGGKLVSVIAPNASIGSFNVNLEAGLNIMNGVMISNDTYIGEGTLINARACIHHDCRIGNYCEIGPGSIITGECEVNNNTIIGAGAIVRPNIIIGYNVVIGAGAVVINNVADNLVIAGVPAKGINS